MWALDLSNATLKFFVSPESVPGGYAIFSHVWDKEEQSFQDIQEIGKRCAMTGENPRDLVCEKIRQFCIIAERDGHEWGWADTCCIDKTSSAELSEAINSMYHYYTLADTCYAYLRDVPTVGSMDLFFCRSRWHKRGWTLQELIAPVLLVFLSRDWERLGTKSQLAEMLEDATRVPATVLRLERDPADFSIAQRMSWAATRKTTRLEDEAYCLMGIFGINMPTLYGEGRLAFRRLQEEIMKQSIDTTLFAWGSFISSRHSGVSATMTRYRPEWPDSYLFARSPSDFGLCKNISFVPPSEPSQTALQNSDVQLTRSLPVELPTFSITPYGVRAHVPLFKLPDWKEDIAVMFWGRSDDLNQQASIGLILTPCRDAAYPSRPLYYCGRRWSGRKVLLHGHSLDNLLFYGKTVDPKWQELYIAHSPPPDTKSIPRLPINSSLSSPFHFPRQQMELLGRHGFILVDVSPASHSWNGDPPVHLVYKFGLFKSDTMSVRLGRCVRVSPPTSLDQPWLQSLSGPHWATVLFYDDSERLQPSDLTEHSCAKDHICDWPDFTRTFKRNPNTTLVVNFVL